MSSQHPAGLSKLDRSSGNLYQYYTILASRSCSWAENVQNKNREWLKHGTCIKDLTASYVLFTEVHILTYQNTHISPFFSVYQIMLYTAVISLGLFKTLSYGQMLLYLFR